MKLRHVILSLCLPVSLALSSMSLAEAVWIDVRTSAEHLLDSIEGDIRISHSEVVVEIERLFPDKSTELTLYCHSGGRAAAAMTALEDAGYHNVSNAGGIDDARRERGLDD